MKRIDLAAILTAELAGPAFAGQTAVDMDKIDAALAKGPQISDEPMAEVKTRRAKGERLRNGGKHQEVVDALANAEEILGIK